MRMPEIVSKRINGAESINENLWASLLWEVQSSRSSRLSSDKCLLILGDNESGKSTLVAKLQGNEDVKRGAGLEYDHIIVRDEYRDEQTRLGLWILDGDSSHAHLLNFSLKPTNMSDTTVVLCVSISEPWNIIDQLSHWTTVLQDHIDSLNLAAERTQSLRKETINRWQSYIDPADDGLTDEIGCSTVKSSRHSRIINDNIIDNIADNRRSNIYSDDDNESLLPLPEDTLTRNLGLDVVVVVTKTDFMVELEGDYDYKEEHFDFVQQAIRRFCLSIGAALVYTSVKENKNCDILYKYLAHKIYGFPFRTPALVVEKDAVFIPAGWDNEKKISILYENMHNLNYDLPYCDVIRKPTVRKTGVNRETEVIAEDEQVFLQRQLQYLQQAPVPRGSPIPSVGGSGQKSLDRKGSSSVPKKLSNDASSSISNSGAATSEGVLANFFNALLSKKPGQTMVHTQPRSFSGDENRTNAELELDRLTKSPPEIKKDPSSSNEAVSNVEEEGSSEC